MPDGKDYLFASEVARMLKVSPKTVSRWCVEGRLPHMRTLGGKAGAGHRRFRRTEIEALRDQLNGEAGGVS